VPERKGGKLDENNSAVFGYCGGRKGNCMIKEKQYRIASNAILLKSWLIFHGGAFAEISIKQKGEING